nr:nicotinamide-nucleotide amidohydrolase family protein [Murinocardiopsis flavida]
MHRMLVERGLTLAAAESLTGGLIGATITAVPGVSASYLGGVISYDNQVKTGVLGVPADLLERCGAVHPEVATAMALGVRRLVPATFGLAVTGVAGPDPQDGRPPGTVFAAVAGPGGSVRSAEFALSGDRALIRNDTVLHGLELVAAMVAEIKPK